MDDSILTSVRPSEIPESDESRAAALRARLSTLGGTGLLRRLSATSKHLADVFARDVEQDSSSDSGTDLVRFLGDRIDAAAGKVNLYVTGHSKGGALSSTLALWLADTQTDWDQNNKATVTAYSFAGPTAGNKEFADHLDSVLRANHHRVVNPFDLVPYVSAVPH